MMQAVFQPDISHSDVNAAQEVARGIPPLSLQGAKQRSNPSGWTATGSGLDRHALVPRARTDRRECETAGRETYGEICALGQIGSGQAAAVA